VHLRPSRTGGRADLGVGGRGGAAVVLRAFAAATPRILRVAAALHTARKTAPCHTPHPQRKVVRFKARARAFVCVYVCAAGKARWCILRKARKKETARKTTRKEATGRKRKKETARKKAREEATCYACLARGDIPCTRTSRS